MLHKITVLFLFSLFAQICGGPVNIPIPNQSFVLSSSLDTGSPYSQTLSISPQQLQNGGTGNYQLNFTVKNFIGGYPGYFTVVIAYGTQELCEMDGWGAVTTRQIVVTCPNPGGFKSASLLGGINRVTEGAPQTDKPFTITFDNGSWPLVIDNLMLTFTATAD